MKEQFKSIAIALSFATLAAIPLIAQEPVVGSSDPESLVTSKDSKLNTNKQAAMHIERDLLDAGHWDEASKWLTEKYIQHNPGFASGRQTVVNAFSARATPRPIPAAGGAPAAPRGATPPAGR